MAKMTFGGAIERGHITDYKIVVICVTDSEVKEIIQRGGRVVMDDEHEWDAKAFAKRVALVKGMKAYGLKKVFTFHSKVKGAKAFTDTKTPYGIHEIFKILEPENDNKEVKFFHVNGTMSSGVRNGIMKEFKEAEIGIMSNARCLTEGVDVPAVDTVAFIDPKKSLIDIVQATGRAMRKAEWKERGYIFIPVVVDENANPDEIIENSEFAAVWEVLQAMVDQDQRLQGVVSNLRVLQGKGEEGSKIWEDTISKYGEKVEFHNLSEKIDKARFIDKLNTKTVEVVGKKWDFWYGLTLKYKELYGFANTLAWVIKELQPFYFDDFIARHPYAAKIYKELYGVANTPNHYWFRLGNWQSTQKQNYKKGLLSKDRIKKLEDIGFVWSPFGKIFEQGFQETQEYKNEFGTANVPNQYKTPKRFRLGTWQREQRQNYKKGKLSKEKVKRLEEIGFKWSMEKDVL